MREPNSVTPLSIHSVTPDLRVSGPLRNADAPEAPATSLTAWPDGQALIADWMRCASGCEFDGSPSSASSDPFVGFSVAVSVAQVALGSVGSLTVPHCVVTLAAVADEVEVLDDEVVDVDDDVDDVVDVEAAVAEDDEASPFAGDDDPPPHAATDALRTAIARRRA